MRDDDSDAPRPKKKKKGKKSSQPAPDRAMSYTMGVFFALIGGGMLIGFQFLDRGPSKLFHMLAAGGVACLLGGLGLLIYPLDSERLDTFQNEPNPIAVFQAMPAFWKGWLLLILTAMVAAFVYVSQNTVRVGA